MKIILLTLSFFISLYASSAQDYTDKANALKLYEKRYWSLLLHMNAGVSEIDSPNFFLAKNGKTDAQAELEATIEGLYNASVLDDNATQCLFPARTFWLKEELGLKDLPQVQCQAYKVLIKKMDPQRASLIFPSAHINSPASSFGHTFIRIDSSMDSKLLSYAVNYAANGNTEDFFYALYGLVGKYPGYYSMMPYYEKLKEYSDTDSRDVWEYDLNLEYDEVMMMVRHIWELQHIYSDYYFIDENCSYNMLWLIEVARPSVHLHEGFLFSVAPPETLFKVKEEGLVQTIKYRPSKRSKLLAYEKKLSVSQVSLAKKVAWGKIDARSVVADIDKESARYVLESASEFLEYLYIQGDVKKEDYLKRFHRILTERSKLGSSEVIKVKKPSSPTQAHRINRLNFQAGVRDGEMIGFLGFRHAFTDLKDSDTGLLRGLQIEFFDTLLSYGEQNEIALERLTLLSITSIAPISKFFNPISWRMKAGWDSLYLDNNRSEFSLSVGAGSAFAGESYYSYMMFDAIGYVDKYSDIGLSASLGLVVDEGRYFKTNIEVSERYFLRHKEQFIFKADQLINLSQNNALHLNYEYLQKLGNDRETFKLIYNFFF